MVITEPLSYTEYNPVIDVELNSSNSKPIICIPVFNRELSTSRVEGCIQIEFKVKHYLSSNPFSGGSYEGRDFKLDFVTKEQLEIFSNQLRISIERLNVLKKYMLKRGVKPKNDISPVRNRLSDLSPLQNPFVQNMASPSIVQNNLSSQMNEFGEE